MKMRELTVQQLKSALAEPAPTRPHLLDVREPWEWKLAKIDGSENVPMQQIPALSEELNRTHPTVVICHHGVRSLQVVAFLERQGFANMHNLQGGIDAWSRQIDPAVPVY